MITFSHYSEAACDQQQGFSLIEVLIGLVLSGLLMSMVAMVLGQSITNNEVIRSSAGLSSRMFTLRRILHRDFQNIILGSSVSVEDNGFGIKTTNNFLIDGGIKVDADWDFSGNMIRRHEENKSLEYNNSFQLLRGLKSWRIEVLDGDKGIWISGVQFSSRSVTSTSDLKAIRLNLVFEDGHSLSLVERIPYVVE
ncbi:prepilin-type N-terminal cleavage/methylation domain-containing protein [Maridesulfovibrio zosterae]|uniref:prepilin-type N-terminal cleavage/methylation domain-containing protein n=1 Tax=Maridesulfovibrio zosterae TaxID=82171 RepID=UPI000420F2F9|nr:prepilin-type N-terminal cleavage/methylation domain-containing protein [Maridesulfovibrio zosterae]